MNEMPKSNRFIFSRGIWISVWISAIAALAFSSITHTAHAGGTSAFPALQVTATPAVPPGVTHTPIPGLPLPPSGPAFYAAKILQSLVLAVILFGVLYFAFTRPGAWSGRNVLELSIGFLGWFLVNTLLWVWVMSGEAGTLFMNPARLIPLLVNILAAVLLSISRRWMVLGIVCAILVNAIALTVFPAPTTNVFGNDRTAARAIVMAPFYIPFFFPGI